MPRANITQQNFTSGELSPKMYGRYDLQSYYNGAERMENFIPQVQGPAKFRPGTRYVTNTPNDNVPTFIPFIFNEEDTYLLEFTDLRVRFFRNSEIVKFVDGADIEAVEFRASKAVIHINSTGTTITFHPWNTVSFTGITADDFGYLNNRSWVVSAVNVSTFNPAYIEVTLSHAAAVATRAAAAESGLADSHVTYVTNFTTADLETMNYKQIYDTMYLTDGNEVVYALTRNSSTSWGLTAHVTTGETFTAANQYPHCVEVYEDRLFLANKNIAPFSFWGSHVGDYTDFVVSAVDDDAFEFQISDSNNDILYMIAYNNFLMAMTLGGAYKIIGADINTPMQPTSVTVRPLHYVGTARVIPVKKDNDLIFVEKGGLKLRQIEYSFQRDRFEPKDLTKLAEHIAGTGFSKIAYQQGKTDTIWCKVNGDELAGLTYDQDENVLAWHRHYLGNNKITSRDYNNGTLREIETIPRADNDDQLWLGIEHAMLDQSLDFNHVCYMEDSIVFPLWENYYTGNFDEDRTRFLGDLFYYQQRSLHLDSAMIYNGSESTTSSLTRLTLGALTGTGVNVSSFNSYFSASDVGREIWGQTGTKSSFISNDPSGVPYGKAIIRSYISATQVTVDIYEDFTKLELSNSSIIEGSDEDEWYLTAINFTGLSHLARQTVSVIVDGEEHDDVYISKDGEVTLDRQGAYVQFGYKYTGIIKSVDIEAGGTIGPAQGKLRNIAKCSVQFRDTVSGKVGSDMYNMEEINFRDSQAIMNRPAELFSGEKMVHFEGNWDREKHIFVIQDKAQPCTVMMLNPYVSTSND